MIIAWLEKGESETESPFSGIGQKSGIYSGRREIYEMADFITPDVFLHLVRLAALELTSEEADYLYRQLNDQLSVIQEMESIPLEENLPTTSHGIPFTPGNRPAIRPDLWAPYPNPDKILEQAPEIEERFIVVPEIPHQELE